MYFFSGGEKKLEKCQAELGIGTVFPCVWPNAPFSAYADMTANIGTVTAHIAAITFRTRPSEPTAIADEKWQSDFLFERVFALSDPHRLLKDLSSGARQF